MVLDLCGQPSGYVGDTLDGGAGTSVDFLPDVDADGADEVLLGVVEADFDARKEGVVHLLLGGGESGSVSLSDSAIDLGGGYRGDEVGHAVAGVEDADGDGAGEVLVGAPGAGSAGTAFLVYGTWGL